MERNIIIGLVAGLAAALLCAYIEKNARKSNKKGRLEFGVSMLLLAFSCLFFVLLSSFIFFKKTVLDDAISQVLALVLLFVGFGISAIYCFGEYFKTRGTFDNTGIYFHTPWTGDKSEKWGDLQSIEHNSWGNWYVLTFKSGDKIRLSNLIHGHGEILKILNYIE